MEKRRLLIAFLFTVLHLMCFSQKYMYEQLKHEGCSAVVSGKENICLDTSSLTYSVDTFSISKFLKNPIVSTPPICADCKVTSFEMDMTYRFTTYSFFAEGNTFTKEMIDTLQLLNQDSHIVIQNVHVLCPDGNSTMIPGSNIVIHESFTSGYNPACKATILGKTNIEMSRRTLTTAKKLELLGCSPNCKITSFELNEIVSYNETFTGQMINFIRKSKPDDVIKFKNIHALIDNEIHLLPDIVITIADL